MRKHTTFKTIGYFIVFFVVLSLSLQLSYQAYTQPPYDCCTAEFSPTGGSVTGYPGDTGSLLTHVTVTVGDGCFETGGEIDLGKPQIQFIGSPPAQGSINLLDPSSQYVKTDNTSATFAIMMELSPDLSPGIYQFTVIVNASCVGISGGNYQSGPTESSTFTLTVLPNVVPQCCEPVIGSQLVTTVDPGSVTTIAPVEVNNNCTAYTGAANSIRADLTVTASVDPSPTSGNMSFSLSSSSINVPYGGSTSVNILGNFSSDLQSDFYQVAITVTATCGGTIHPSRTYTDTKTFTIYVQPVIPNQCCLPSFGPQLNTTAVPGDRVPLASIFISNSCYTAAGEFESQPQISVENLKIFPEPSKGQIFLLPVPPQLKVLPGDFCSLTLFAIVTSDVPTGFYQIHTDIKVECFPPRERQDHTISGDFTLAVQTERERTFISGMTIPPSSMEGVCVAPGSTLLIPINTLAEPETFKWEGLVDFNDGEKHAKILAASHRAVITVIPPGLEGETILQVTGPQGRSNRVRVTVNKSCISNRGREITEAQLRAWADQVPEDLKDRATDQTGEMLSFVPGEILVQFNGTSDQLESLKSKYGVLSVERIPPTDLYVFRLKDRGIRNTTETADGLANEPGVQYASENGIMTLVQEELNDPDIDAQEQLRATNIFTGWKAFFPIKGRGVKVAVVDTGLDLEVKDEVRTSRLAPNGVDVSGGHQDLSLLLGTSTADDRRGHGTIVSSIASAQGDNEKFGAGVAFNSRVIPVKVFGQSRFTPQDIIAKGLIAAFYLEADVVNMSLGCARCRPSKERQSRKYFDRVLDILYKDFDSQGLVPPIVVAATGNDGEGIVDTPAADPRVIAVGSYNLKTNKKSRFSNYGEEVDFVAPGENVYTILLGGEFGDAGSGTSFSCPQGAGLVALILSTQPMLKELGTQAVKEKIKECFIKDVGEPGFDKETGWGMIYIPEPEEVDPSKCLVFEKSAD